MYVCVGHIVGLIPRTVVHTKSFLLFSKKMSQEHMQGTAILDVALAS